MSLEHAILGFLNYQPMSGYDLKKTFDASVRHFWPADQSQIYRTLARLQEEGKTTVELVDQADRPDRKVYHITPAGKQELLRWLTSTLEVEPSRSPQMIQVFFAANMPDEAVLKVFEDGAAYLRQTLAMYDSFPPVVEEFSRHLGTPRDAFFWGLTVESGRDMTRSSLEWMESVIKRIKAGELPPITETKGYS